ncbi:MAG: hypothetical protein ACJ73E_16365 [Mycobacteriales bacterium]
MRAGAGGWRWGVVAVGLAGLVSLPLAVGALPARSDPASTTDLVDAVRRSGTQGYSGYAEAVGGLSLPLTEDFSTLTDLFGDRARLRVWWRGDQDWRVDTVQATGETGLYRDVEGLWTWEYERGTALRTTEAAVRLPRAADLEPAALGRRLLSEAGPAELSRLPARRVADRSAPGLRLRPADPASTVERVDVWVDRGTGVPLRVEVYGVGSARPVVETSYLDFSPMSPPAGTTRFAPPYPERVRRELNPDLAAAIDVFSPVVPPLRLAGLPVRTRVQGLGSVGTYGTGLTVLVAVPLPGRVSRPLREQLSGTPGTAPTALGVRLTVGPLSLLLTDPAGRRSWLLTGTVSAQTLDRAAGEIAADPPVEEPG